MITEVKGKCAYPGCEKPAESIATGRDTAWREEKEIPMGVYCEQHASDAADQGSPEYTVHCPNCGCRFGVN